MATITTRSGKGSPLTNSEVDANFTNLNTDKLELAGGTLTGNLLLGKASASGTSGSSGDDGLEIRPTFFSFQANTVASYLNTRTDGNIQVFQKDGVSTGSIQARGGDIVIGTGDTGIRFSDAENAIMPHHATDVVDNQIDLGFSGSSNYRFKDLHLSGTVNASVLRVNSGTTEGPKFMFGNDNRNLYLAPSSASSDIGLSFFNGSGNWTMQLYGYNNGSIFQYGFLDANWASWDIQKTVNGAFKVDEGSGLQRVFNDGYHPNADAWTTSRTLSLTGDVTGSVSWDGSGNASLAATVANDSHTHDGRYYTETEADGRFAKGQTSIGSVDANNLTIQGFYGNSNASSNQPLDNNAGTIIHMRGSDGNYKTQLFSYSDNRLYHRGKHGSSQSWQSWERVFMDNYHPNADAWTTARTLSLTGDATGSVSIDGSSNVSLSVSVGDADLLDGYHGSNYIGKNGYSYYNPNTWIDFNTSNSGLYWSGGSATGWHIYPADTSDMQLRSGNTNVGLRFNISGNLTKGYVYANSSSEIGFLNDSRNWSLRVDNSGNTFATASHRAAVFYDSDNTAYYVNPDSTSVVNQVIATNIEFGDTSGPILSQERDQNLKLQGSNGSSVGITGYGGDGNWDFQIYGAGGQQGFLKSNWGAWSAYADTSGNWFGTNSVRAPTFYDSDNTTYYLDPASTSDSALRVRGGALFGGNTTWGDFLMVGGDGRQNYINNTTTASVATTDGNLHLDAASGHATYLNYYDGDIVYFGSGSNSQVARVTNAGVAQFASFTDSNDTFYYVDPASRSVMGSIDFNQAISETSEGARVGRNHAYNTLELQGHGAELMIGSQGTSLHINYRTCNNGTSGHTPTQWYWRAGTSTNWSNHSFGDIISYGILTATSDVRAPLFYDSGNTGYYVDPATLSRVYRIQAGGSIDSTPNGTAFSNVLGAVTVGGQSGRACYFDGGGVGASVWWGNGNSPYGAIDSDQANGLRFYYNNSSGTWSEQFRVSDGYTYAINQSRAPIFYDSNNTAYYVHADGTSNIYNLQTANQVVIGGTWANNNFSSVSSTRLTFGGADNINSYYIGTNMNDYGGNYTKLDLAWHTGIRMGAQATYGGVRIFDSESLGTRLFSVGEGDTNVRVSNSLYAGETYDLDNTAYYTDPSSESRMARLHVGDGSNYIRIGDEGEGANTSYSRIRTNSSGDLFLDAKGSQNIYLGWWSSTASRVYSEMGAQFPIYYDRNNTAYYFDGSATGDSIRVAGNIVAYYSDERLKNIEGNIDSPLEKVSQLNGFYYKANKKAQTLGYKDNRQVGVSAQQVEAVMPEVVTDAAIGRGYKTVDYAKLVPLLIEAVKEQQDQIEALKSRLEKLEN